MGREGRDYWEAQLSEYWDSGLTIQVTGFEAVARFVRNRFGQVAAQPPLAKVLFAGVCPVSPI